MKLADVANEIVVALGGVAKVEGQTLRRYASPPDSVTPPCAVVVLPEEINYRVNYGPNANRMSLLLLLLVGRPGERNLLNRIGPYTNGSGDASIRQVLEAYQYETLDVLTVPRCTFDVVTWGSTDYVGAIFDLDIIGQGVV